MLRSIAFILAVALALFTGALVSLAQEEGSGQEEPTGLEEEGEGLPTWRPRGGALFGTSGPTYTPAGQQGPESDPSERPLRPGEEEAPVDDRPELLVFELYFGDGVTFPERYHTQLVRAFERAVQESQAYRPLTPNERRRRMTTASQIVGEEVSNSYAEDVAVAIEAEYYLIPRIVVENSRTYRLTMTFGQSGAGEEGRVTHQATSNRVVDNVERELVGLTRNALEGPIE